MSLDQPVRRGFSIVPHDTNALAVIPRGIYVGGAGDVVVTLQSDSSSITFKAVPVGTILPVRAKKVHSTGTTATLLLGLY